MLSMVVAMITTQHLGKDAEDCNYGRKALNQIYIAGASLQLQRMHQHLETLLRVRGRDLVIRGQQLVSTLLT